MRPPLWVYRKIFQAYGGRLPKADKSLAEIEKEKCKSTYYLSMQSPNAIEYARQKANEERWAAEDAKRGIKVTFSPQVAPCTPPPLEAYSHSDQLFWYTSKWVNGRWAMCRVCGQVTYGAAARTGHLETGDCRIWTARTLRQMRLQTNCAVCDFPMQHKVTRYGVFLCCQACVDIWLYDFTKGRTLFTNTLGQLGWLSEEDKKVAQEIASYGSN